jgi:hypothetical protein
MRADVAGKPVYLGLAMSAEQTLKLKPQNLLINLPLARRRRCRRAASALSRATRPEEQLLAAHLVRGDDLLAAGERPSRRTPARAAP